MESRAVYCPNCSSQVRGDNINIQELVGKCDRCDHIFRLDFGDVAAENEALGSEPSRPSGVTMETGVGNELLIIRRWFHPTLFFLMFFCIAWDGFLVFWYSMALYNPAQGDGFEWIAILFPICHVAVGVGLTYYVIAGFLNRSTIRVDKMMLQVRHHPIPWLGNRDLDIEEIQGIEIDPVYSNVVDNNNYYQPAYAVSAHVTEGSQVVLINGVKRKLAEYIGWQLANRLKVQLSHNESEPRRWSWFGR